MIGTYDFSCTDTECKRFRFHIMERRLDSRRGAVVPKVEVAPPQLEKF